MVSRGNNSDINVIILFTKYLLELFSSTICSATFLKNFFSHQLLLPPPPPTFSNSPPKSYILWKSKLSLLLKLFRRRTSSTVKSNSFHIIIICSYIFIDLSFRFYWKFFIISIIIFFFSQHVWTIFGLSYIFIVFKNIHDSNVQITCLFRLKLLD